jgi:hydrogenase maturation protease
MMGGDGQGRVILIGVGNEFRTDDGLGVLVAREIRRRGFQGIEILEHTGEGSSLMLAWGGAAAVLIVDAVASGAEPGFVHRVDASTTTIPRHFFHYSSHEFGVIEAIEMARHLRQLPPTLLLYGIEGERYEQGMGLSDAVVRSVPDLLSLIENDISHIAHT